MDFLNIKFYRKLRQSTIIIQYSFFYLETESAEFYESTDDSYLCKCIHRW